MIVLKLGRNRGRRQSFCWTEALTAAFHDDSHRKTAAMTAEAWIALSALILTMLLSAGTTVWKVSAATTAVQNLTDKLKDLADGHDELWSANRKHAKRLDYHHVRISQVENKVGVDPIPPEV